MDCWAINGPADRDRRYVRRFDKRVDSELCEHGELQAGDYASSRRSENASTTDAQWLNGTWRGYVASNGGYRPRVSIYPDSRTI